MIKMRFPKHILVLLILLSVISGCNSSQVKDALDLAFDPPERQPLDTTRMGINAFVNESAFGSIGQQFAEVKSTLRINFVRILFSWNDAVQPSPGATPDFGFYDNIASKIPAGMDALVVLTGLPNWMTNSANWINGNPRETFVELFVKKILRRYRDNDRIIGWQIWNEPNMLSNQNNVTLGIADSPANYLELLAFAYDFSKGLNSKVIVSAATTAIAQNFPQTNSYNRDLIEMGIQDVIDVYGLHVYGKQYENYFRDGGVKDTLGQLTKPIWVTESGAQGVNAQLPYTEEVWGFLRDEIPQIDRIYYYQFTESTPAGSTYGLRNLTPGTELSDLYIFLRDR